MSDMNLCIFEGNLTRDPELSQAGETNVVRFTIAVNTKRGKGKERTAFADCEAWDKGAELIAKHFEKGKPIRVFAEYITDKYTDKEGKTVYRHKYRVNEFFFVNRGAGTAQTEGGEEAPKSTAPKASTTKTTRKPAPKPEPEDDGDGDDDQDIPF
jgi:single-strand DNA-binding protein